MGIMEWGLTFLALIDDLIASWLGQKLIIGLYKGHISGKTGRF
jgi:hypothetical protein